MENLKLDDFTKYKFLSGTKFSPDGKYGAFIVHTMNVTENKYKSNIWIIDTKTKKYFQLTSFNEENNFIWLDNSNILFSGLRNAKDKSKKEKEEFTQFYKINIHGGEAIEYFRIPLNVDSIQKIDGNLFSIIATNNPYKKISKEEKDYEILDEIPFWSNGMGFMNKKRNRLYIYNIHKDKIEPITDELTNVENVQLNKDKTKILFTCEKFENKLKMESNLYLYNINKESLEKLNDEEKFAYSYANFIDNKIIFLATDMKKYGVNENNHFYIMDLETKNTKKITTTFDYSTHTSVGSDCRYGQNRSFKIDNEHLYFITTEFDSSYINKIDKNGNIKKVTHDTGAIDGFDILNGNILFIGLKNMKLQELYSLEDGKETQLTTFNEWVVKNKKLSKPEKIKVKTDKNVIIEGWIMKPVDFDENKKYPAILDIHGGPKTVYGEVFFHEMQYWVNEGYVVFFCNPRGSDGRGNEFADIRGKYGTIDYEDLMNFTDEILKRYTFIDKEKLGVTGGSYGGFMTNWIIGHTNRFKAAASQRSISNWISKFGITDIGYFFVDDQQKGTPWNNPEKLWFHSPLKYANKVKTPTLFIHSEEDYRCYIAEGFQMFTALKYHGIDSRLCMFRGENHELSRSGKPKHRIKRLKEITNWFDKYLK